MSLGDDGQLEESRKSQRLSIFPGIDEVEAGKSWLSTRRGKRAVTRYAVLYRVEEAASRGQQSASIWIGR